MNVDVERKLAVIAGAKPKTKDSWDEKREALPEPKFTEKLPRGTDHKAMAKQMAKTAASLEKIGDTYAKHQATGTSRYDYGVKAYRLARKHLRVMKQHQVAHKKTTGEIDYTHIWNKAAYGNQDKTGRSK